jgi:hypothetical protein
LILISYRITLAAVRRPRRVITLGPHFSEAARQLWLALLGRGWNPNDLARHLVDVVERRAASPRSGSRRDLAVSMLPTPRALLNARSLGALVRRWVYGHTSPRLAFAGLLQDELGIACGAWTEPPRLPFVPVAFPRQRARRVGGQGLGRRSA